jgi:starch phosphorylase
MKAAANGALNLSVLDGWWCEGNDLDTGWAIGSGEVYDDPEAQDQIECEALFNLLEQEIIPLFYDRDKSGLPRDWIKMMKSSMRKLGARFNTHRMVQEYAEFTYLPAHRAGEKLKQSGFTGAKALAAWRSRITEGWPQLSIRMEEVRKEKEVPVGATFGVSVRVNLGRFSPDDVSIEVYHGAMDMAGEIREGGIVRARHDRKDGDADIFLAEIPCKVTGRYGYTARVMPKHPDLVNPFTPLLITWE